MLVRFVCLDHSTSKPRLSLGLSARTEASNILDIKKARDNFVQAFIFKLYITDGGGFTT